MDNLRSLSGSLPPTTPSRRLRASNQQQQQPPEQLLQAFKAAAHTVTSLYKTASSDILSAHSDGYRDALEDLAVFLDRENLGLNDGEGWRVRQWATERLANQNSPSDGSEDEEVETENAEKRARSSSPMLQHKKNTEQAPNSTLEVLRAVSPPRSGSAPPVQPASTTQSTQFTFQSSHQYPQGQEIEMSNGNGNGQSQQQNTTRPTRTSRHGSSLRSNHNLHNRSAANLNVNFNVGSGAGAKRKLPFVDFFDISGLGNGNGNGNGNGREGQGGGGKRNRLA